MASRSGSIFKKSIQYIIMLAIAVVLLWFAFRGVKWGDFVEGLKDCDFTWVGISMVASLGAFIVRGARWRLIMLPINPEIKTREAYDGVAVGYLTNFALPRAGELARCGVIARTGKASFEAALGSVVLERAIDMLSLILIVVATLIFRWEVFGSFFRDQIWQPMVGALSFNLIWILLALLLIIVLTVIFIRKNRAKLSGNKFYSKIANIWRGLVEGLKSGFKMKKRGLFLLYTVLLWVIYWFMSFASIQAFPSLTGLNGMDALFLMIAGSLGWVVPVPGGIGAYHFIVSLALLSLYGVPQNTGVIFATVSHESQALVMLIFGALSLLSVSLYKNKKKQ